MEKLFFALVFTLSFITISQATEIEKTWEVVGFSMPEPVVVSPKDQWIYVSNINGDKMVLSAVSQERAPSSVSVSFRRG